MASESMLLRPDVEPLDDSFIKDTLGSVPRTVEEAKKLVMLWEGRSVYVAWQCSLLPLPYYFSVYSKDA